MITAITTYRLPKPIARDEARRMFLSTAPKYQGIAGLIRKYYVVSQDMASVGGIYLWNSRAEADALDTEGWKAFVREKSVAEPSITYLDSPVVLENLTPEIVS